MRIQSGELAKSKHDPEWRLYEGEGERVSKYLVTFPQEFRNQPKVVVALKHMDVIDGSNHRLTVEARSVSTDHFEVEFKTWASTQVWSAGVSWIAYSED